MKVLVSYTLTLYVGVSQPRDDDVFPMCKNTHWMEGFMGLRAQF
jgi:hypothetical protein